MPDAGHNLLKVAQVLKSNGTDGELVMGFRDIAPEDLDLKEPVFIIFDGLPVPFYIESFASRGTAKALVRLTDVRDIRDAEELTGKAVYIKDDGDGSEEDNLEGLVGWTVMDSSHNEIGIISDFYDIPGNPCIEVGTVSGTVMIPLHEDLVISFDEDDKILEMVIPDGLLQSVSSSDGYRLK